MAITLPVENCRPWQPSIPVIQCRRPRWSAPTGRSARRDRQADRRLLLPKGETYGCTREACGFRDHVATLEGYASQARATLPHLGEAGVFLWDGRDANQIGPPRRVLAEPSISTRPSPGFHQPELFLLGGALAARHDLVEESSRRA